MEIRWNLENSYITVSHCFLQLTQEDLFYMLNLESEIKIRSDIKVGGY